MAVPISSGLDGMVFLKIEHSVGEGGSNRKSDELFSYALSSHGRRNLRAKNPERDTRVSTG